MCIIRRPIGRNALNAAMGGSIFMSNAMTEMRFQEMVAVKLAKLKLVLLANLLGKVAGGRKR